MDYLVVATFSWLAEVMLFCFLIKLFALKTAPNVIIPDRIIAIALLYFEDFLVEPEFSKNNL